MLSEYKGPANSSEMLQYLVGEKIVGCMIDGAHFVIVLGSGTALILTSSGTMFPSYYKESGHDLMRRLELRKSEIERRKKEIESITFLTSACKVDGD